MINNQPKQGESYCPHCQARYSGLKPEAEGRRTTCRRCNQPFTIRFSNQDPEKTVISTEPRKAEAGAGAGALEAQTRLVRNPDQAPAPTVPDFALISSGPLVSAGTGVEWSAGEIVLNLYRVLDLLGEGGMGRVYLVRHLGWDLDLAVKTATPQTLAAAGGADAFEREAETWVNLGLHPHTVSCYYVRRIGGVPCVFAEYVAGGSLHDWISPPGDIPGRLYEGGEEKALARILDLAIQFAWGLNYAHAQDLIHRDVKPANVLVTPSGAVKVTDFGLAGGRPLKEKLLGHLFQAENTSSALPAGTPQYFSPEQARGKPLTLKTDLWSWGLCVLEMFQGGRTWESGTVAAALLDAYRQNTGLTPWIPRMPQEVGRLLELVFRENPRDRPKDLAEVSSILIREYQARTGRNYPRPEPKAGRDTADSLNNRAVSLLDLGRKLEAKKFWNLALKKQTHHPEATYNAGLLAWRSAQLNDDALVTRLDEASSSQTNSWTAVYALSLVHLERGDLKGLQRCLKKLPESECQKGEIQALAESARKNSDRAPRQKAIWTGHQGAVNVVRVHSSGKVAATGGDDRVIRIWDLKSGNTLFSFQENQGPVSALCFLEKGSLLASGGGDFGTPDYSIKIWDLKNKKIFRELLGHEKRVHAVCLSQDGKILLSASDDHSVRVWDVASGTCIKKLTGALGAATTAWLSPDGKTAFLAGVDRRIRGVDFGSNRLTLDATGHQGRVLALVLSLDGRTLFSGGSDQTIRQWDRAGGKMVRVLEGHRAEVNSLDLSRDGKWALSGSSDQTIKLWDLSSGRCFRTFEGQESWVMGVSFFPDADQALSAGLDGTVRLWHLAAGTWQHPSPFLPSRVTGTEAVLEAGELYEQCLKQARMALDNKDWVRTAGWVKKARGQPGFEQGKEALSLWFELYVRLPRGGFVSGWEGRTLKGHEGEVSAGCFSPDGSWVVSGGADKLVRIWDAETGREIKRLAGNLSSVNALAVTPDGARVISGGEDGSIRIWDRQTGQLVRSANAHPGGVRTLRLTVGGRFILSGGQDRLVRLWEEETLKPVRELSGHRGPVNCVDADLGARRIVSASGDHTGEDCVVKIWDRSTGECLKTLEHHARAVNAVRLTMFGDLAVSASSDQTIHVRSTTNENQDQVLHEHQDGVNSLALSQDGTFLVSGGYDATVRLWSLETGTCHRSFSGHSGSVNAVDISPDGRLVLSASADGTLKIWVLDWNLKKNPSNKWEAQARKMIQGFVTASSEGTEAPEPDLDSLMHFLGRSGLGWVDPEWVRQTFFKGDEKKEQTKSPEPGRDEDHEEDYVEARFVNQEETPGLWRRFWSRFKGRS